MVWQQETRTAYESFIARNRVAGAVILAFFALLSARLVFLQIIRGQYFTELSERQRTKIIIEHAPRGSIFDRAGRLLLGTKTNYAALFYPFAPSSGAPDPAVIAQLRDILGRDPGPALAQSMRSGQVVKLADKLTREQMFRIEEKRLIMPGLSIVREPQRAYVNPEANAHLVGYLSEVTARELESAADDDSLKMGDMIGRGGLELYYDRYLRGQDGGLQIEVDFLGHQTRLVRHIGTRPGSALRTTIDADLQNAAAEALKASPTGRGAVVGIDPRPGAVRVQRLRS
jgi:penicillin-binding protein 2